MSKNLSPQAGFQTDALSTCADIAILGGAAGAGKTFTLLMEPLRHIDNPDFSGVIFRRTTPQIKAAGALWDSSQKIYPFAKGDPKESSLSWHFPSGAKMKFSHLEYAKNVLDWQGSEIAFLAFDELTHFDESSFFYLLSRNRSSCGVRPYVRATCNPDPDSWVAKFIDWWIGEDGFPVQERCGMLRYFTRDNDVMIWGDSPEEVMKKCPHIFNNEAIKETGIEVGDLIKSVTFIGGDIYSNKIFIKQDPAYLGNLLSLPDEERTRLLEGNWKIRTDNLCIFNYEAINDVFTNYPDESPNAQRYITCDAARFGRDFCVVMVWKGWEVVHTVVFKKSDAHDVVKCIEDLRRKFMIFRHHVLIDQDGVGGDYVKLGNYKGFKGGNTPVRDPDTRVKENYKNLKTQCYYRLANDHVNIGNIRINISNNTCQIYDDSRINAQWSTKIKIGNTVADLRDLIKQDLRAIKRDKIDQEGKICINPKEMQKEILGRSPDFGDCMSLRVLFELKRENKSISQKN